jgi:hypothetical protein
MTNKDTLQHVFPAELLRFFEIIGSNFQIDKTTGEDFLEVIFQEKNDLPEGYSRADYVSKGFLIRRVQDFPLRGKAVFLIVRRRRWRHKRTGQELTRDFTFLAEGTHLTAELADFLKQGG